MHNNVQFEGSHWKSQCGARLSFIVFCNLYYCPKNNNNKNLIFGSYLLFWTPIFVPCLGATFTRMKLAKVAQATEHVNLYRENNLKNYAYCKLSSKNIEERKSMSFLIPFLFSCMVLILISRRSLTSNFRKHCVRKIHNCQN